MKVFSVELRNFKRHEDLVLDVQGRNIFLLGPNEVGKSSILDSIDYVLNPEKETAASKIPAPLTRGKKAGHIGYLENPKAYLSTFQALWNSLHKKTGWEKDKKKFVWVIDYKIIKHVS